MEIVVYAQLQPTVNVAMETTEIMLADKLSDNPELLSSQLADIEVYHYRISYLLAQADALVSRSKYLCSPTEKMNDFNKKIYIEAYTVKEVFLRDALERRLKDIEVRIQTAQSLLAYSREIAKMGGKESV
ncbi:MAG: hypothetical protein WC479_09770 [Candidatus Izemoplasmatales bacterium]